MIPKPLGTNVTHLNGNLQQNEWHPSKQVAFLSIPVPGADKWRVIVTDAGKGLGEPIFKSQFFQSKAKL